MNVQAAAPFASRPNVVAGALALGVHALFVLLLVFGVSWQTQHPVPVMVDLWSALPPLSATRPPAPARDVPVRQPEPRPVLKPAPVPKPVHDEAPPPKAPDIALEKKKLESERLKKLKAMQAIEDQTRADAARKEAEAIKQARDKQQAEQKKRDALRQIEADELAQGMAEETAATEARAAAGKRQAELARTVGLHRDLISATVRGNTRLPDNLKGNPQVRCLVKLLPTGDVVSVRVTQSSGNPAYDEAVVRAIEKSSRLPLPSERDARAAFVPELSFVHRPKE